LGRYNKYIILIALVIGFIANSCTKTKIGTYTLIIEGTKYEVQRNAYCCDTTGVYSLTKYYTETEVKITHVGNSTIEIGGNIWEKNGKTISLVTNYDSNNITGHPLGGGDRYTETYNGSIISDILITGEYVYKGFAFAYASKTYSTTIQAKFTIKKN